MPTGVVVSSVVHSPLASLYHTLRTVYSPLLGSPAVQIKGAANGNANGNSAAPDPKLQDLLAQLEAGLGSALRGGASAKAGPEGPDNGSLLGILRPEDEFQMWAELAGGGGGGALQRRAAELSKHFDPLWRPFSELGKGEIKSEEAVLELLDNTQEALDGAWSVKASDAPGGWGHQQHRMENLMNLIGASLMGHAQTSLKGTNIWSMPLTFPLYCKLNLQSTGHPK